MTEREAAELLKAKIQQEKLNTYEYLVLVSRMSNSELIHSGFGRMTKAEACLDVITRASKKILNMIVEHEEKYPD